MAVTIASGQGLFTARPTGLFLRLPGRETGAEAEPIIYDPTPDFSVSRGNPNGVWSYGWSTLGFGFFSLYDLALTSPFPFWRRSATNEPNIFMPATPAFGVAAGQLALHPGPSTEPCILRWKSPRAFREVRIAGIFYAGDAGFPNVAVRRGNTTLWFGSNAGPFDVTTRNVRPGDTVDFAVYDAYFNGSTPLEVTLAARV